MLCGALEERGPQWQHLWLLCVSSSPTVHTSLNPLVGQSHLLRCFVSLGEGSCPPSQKAHTKIPSLSDCVQ